MVDSLRLPSFEELCTKIPAGGRSWVMCLGSGIKGLGYLKVRGQCHVGPVRTSADSVIEWAFRKFSGPNSKFYDLLLPRDYNHRAPLSLAPLPPLISETGAPISKCCRTSWSLSPFPLSKLDNDKVAETARCEACSFLSPTADPSGNDAHQFHHDRDLLVGLRVRHESS